jgi:uncharacterized damage-inducible protein DinB
MDARGKIGINREAELSAKKENAAAGEAVEPWLSGTLTDVPAVPRAVLHALELAALDLKRWCSGLSDEEMNTRPGGVAPVAFHLRHIARSLDRLLTYAECRELSPEQIAALKAELLPRATAAEVFAELEEALERSAQRIRAIDPGSFEEPRLVGRKQLPTTVGGLLVHCAEHTQRHVGQAVTTGKILLSQRDRSG